MITQLLLFKLVHVHDELGDDMYAKTMTRGHGYILCPNKKNAASV
jgi:hypothetical protein